MDKQSPQSGIPSAGKNNLFSLLMLLLIVLILAFLIYTFAWDINILKTKKDETIIQSKTDKYILSSLPNDPIKGDSVFLVSIYLFIDYQAENAVEILDILNNLMVKYPNDLHLVWKDLPLPKHYFAKGAALAARCALDENKYWEYSDQLLKRETSLSLDLYQNIAKDLKMNLDNFLSCYKSGKYLYDIENNVREAYVLDIYDIPTIFINQSKIEGEISFEKLDKIIKDLIK
jgi:protein-disulfide isomerase